MILRIDDIVSGMKKKEKKNFDESQQAQVDPDTVNYFILIFLVW
jgi:hypothetical protein